MKRILIGLVIVLMAGPVVMGQDREERDLSTFSKIWAAEGIDVVLVKGNKEKAVVEAEDIELDRVLTEVEGSTLKIHIDGYNKRAYDVKVKVTFTQLTDISASSAANIYSESVITADNLELSCSSAGDIEVEVDVKNNLGIDVSSSGDITVEGKAGNVIAEASSAGEIDGYDLVAVKVRARASSAGTIKIQVTEEIDARASSAGTIRYMGSPKTFNTDSSSGGSVKRVN